MLLITLVIGLIVMTVQYFGLRDSHSRAPSSTNTGPWTLWMTMPHGLRTLLAVDCLVRIGEGIAASFIVLFVIQGEGFSAADFGVLYGIQHLVAIASYLPGARIAGVTGRPPVVALTFAFFALFPLSVRLATGYSALIAAFVIGGLKEIGEPARKSMILDFAPCG